MDWSTYTSDLNIPNTWECTSYNNDALPSYQVGNLHIWVDSGYTIERQENAYNIYGLGVNDPLPPRFTVFNSDFYNGLVTDESPELLATDSFKELLEFVITKGIK